MGLVPPGYGGVDFDGIIRALNQIGYSGPLSIGWEDSGMGRFFGGTEACAFTQKSISARPTPRLTMPSAINRDTPWRRGGCQASAQGSKGSEGDSQPKCCKACV